MTRRLNRLVPVLAPAVLLGAIVTAFAQTGVTQRPPLVIDSLLGRDLYDFYCANCHGSDGRGRTPLAASLRNPPPDLTGMTVRNGGSFPRQRIITFVTHGAGAQPAAHGSATMPVWGSVFRGLAPSDTRAAIRVANIVDYLESLQVRTKTGQR